MFSENPCDFLSEHVCIECYSFLDNATVLAFWVEQKLQWEKKSWKKNILDCDKSQKSVDNLWIETSWVLIGSRKNDRGNPAEDWGAQRGLQVSGLLFDRLVRFSYSSRPRPLQARRKYRNEAGSQETGYRNLMFDRRIVRGNTYAREDVLPVTAQVTQFISEP